MQKRYLVEGKKISDHYTTMSRFAYVIKKRKKIAENKRKQSFNTQVKYEEKLFLAAAIGYAASTSTNAPTFPFGR